MVIVGLSLEKKEYLIRFQIIYNSNKKWRTDVATKTITNKFENHLLFIRDERQKMIRPNCHPTNNERHQKIIELIDWTLGKYRANRETQQREQTIIDNMI